MTKTMIINKRTNEAYVSAEESMSVPLTGELKEIITLTTEDGATKEVSPSTFKRWYKTVEVKVEEPKAEEKPMTKHQQAALENIEGAYTYVLGGYENSVQDGQMDEMPATEDLFNEVYDEAMNSGHRMLGGLRTDGGEAPICMRFVGKAFVREQIAEMFRKDGYEVPADLIKVPEKKPGHSNFVDEERVNLRKDEAENTVEVRAFTGMLIGTFEVVKETSKTITVKTSKGNMKFDKNTGIQINANNPKFANRIRL